MPVENWSEHSVTQCSDSLGEDASDRAFLLCIIDTLHQERTRSTTSVFLVLAAALVFFMQAGFAMVCAGAVRKKNVQNTMLKNLLDSCASAIAFFFVGFAFAFGGQDADNPGTTFMGYHNFFLIDVDEYGFWLFQYAFSAASATIVAGTLAERCQMSAYFCYSLMLTGWVYPIVAHSVWSYHGFLSAVNSDPLWGVGMVDFAGSAVVHVTGGLTALLAASILGPRRGRFHGEDGRRLSKPKAFPGSSFALQMLGTFILWFGWTGFNGGAALLYGNFTLDTHQNVALAATNTTLSAGMAGMSALFVNLWYEERITGEVNFDLRMAMNGALGGLVAITGGCGVVEPFAAVIIGFLAGINFLIGSRFLEKVRIDDAVDAIPVHLFNGVLGVLAVGFLASPRRLETTYGRSEHAGLFYSWYNGHSDATLLAVQIVGLLSIVAWVTAIMLPFFIWLDWKGWFRSDPLEELVGLDTSYHGGLALLTGTGSDGVNPEYITAYKKKRSEEQALRHRRGAVNPNSRCNEYSSSDPQGSERDSAMDDEESADDTTVAGVEKITM